MDQQKGKGNILRITRGIENSNWSEIISYSLESNDKVSTLMCIIPVDETAGLVGLNILRYLAVNTTEDDACVAIYYGQVIRLLEQNLPGTYLAYNETQAKDYQKLATYIASVWNTNCIVLLGPESATFIKLYRDDVEYQESGETEIRAKVTVTRTAFTECSPVLFLYWFLFHEIDQLIKKSPLMIPKSKLVEEQLLSYKKLDMKIIETGRKLCQTISIPRSVVKELWPEFKMNFIPEHEKRVVLHIFDQKYYQTDKFLRMTKDTLNAYISSILLSVPQGIIGPYFEVCGFVSGGFRGLAVVTQHFANRPAVDSHIYNSYCKVVKEWARESLDVELAEICDKKVCFDDNDTVLCWDFFNLFVHLP